MAEFKFDFRAPSSAPKPTARRATPRRPATGAVVPLSRAGYPRLRTPSAPARQALTLPGQVTRAVDRAYTVQREDDGGILGSIVAPFRVAGEKIGGLGLNVLRGLAPIPEGTARLVYENARDIGQMALSPLPGIDFAPAAKRFGERTGGMVRGLGEDISFTFGPLIEGDFATAARRAYNEPVRVLGTAALVYPVAGAAIGGTARAGALAGRTAAAAAGRAPGAGTRFLEAVGSKRTVAEAGQPLPRRARPPEIIQPPARTRTGGDVSPLPGETDPLIRQRRPRSANPITREFQRYVSEPTLAAARGAVGRIPIRIGGKDRNPLSPAARYERIARGDVRNSAFGFVANMDNDFLRTSRDFQKLIRRVPKILGPVRGTGVGAKKQAKAAYYAVAIRAMGLNNLSRTQTSRTWGRDSLIKSYEDAKQKYPQYAKTIDDNIEALRSVPDEWLDPSTAPKIVNDLTQSATKILDQSSDLKMTANMITPETADFAKRRAQYIAAGVFDEAEYMRRAIRVRDKATRMAVRAGATAASLRTQRAKMVTENAAESEIRSIDSRIRGALEDERRNRNKAARLQKRADQMQSVISSKFDMEMEPGSYFPNIRRPMDGGQQKSTKRPVGTASPRMTLPEEKQNRGVILREGTAAFTPDIILGALKDAIDVSQRAAALEKVLAKYVVKDSDGNPITVPETVRAAERTSDLYVARTKKQLLRVMAAREGSPEADELMAAIDELPDSGRKYLIPRAVEKGWKDALGTRQNMLDKINNAWKAGVLALSPRWYVQNGIGMSLQFILGAGLDLQAIRMAFSKKYADQVLAEIDASGLSSDMGELARRVGERPSRSVLKRIIVGGYKMNAALEAVPRRAMYWHAVRKKAKEEGRVSQTMFLPTSANSARLAEAWLGVVKGAERGEKWADDVIGQATLETERFMGQYLRYNPFERKVLRRAFPFYGWMRAIHRLAFALPVKYPKRAALLAAASRMAYEMYSDEESSLLDPYAGLITGENTFVGLGIMNPIESLSPTMDAAGRVASAVREGELGKIPGIAIQEGYRQLGPALTIPASVAMQRNALGIPARFGVGGDVVRDPQSGRTYGLDPVTGRIIDETPVPGAEYLLGQNFPIYNAARRLVAGEGARPTADAALSDLIEWRLRGSPAEDVPRLFATPNVRGRSIGQIGRTTDFLSTAVGVPVYRYDPNAALMEQLDRARRYAEARKQDYRSRIRTQALYQSGYR